MGNTYTITGFPGFLANFLVRELCQMPSVEQIYLCVLPDTKHKAEHTLKSITDDLAVTPRITIINTDITDPNLTWDHETYDRVCHDTTHLIHLAAIYDLAVPHDLAFQVNVLGTKHVNTLAEHCDQLTHYLYFSTAFVAGKQQGVIKETELNHDAMFKNHYEQTKYEAEVFVEELKSRVPTTIVRPGIVVGDSLTGETDKFDGPYFLLNSLAKFKYAPILPFIGNGNARANFVPIDYIVNASLHLLHSNRAIGQTFHLTDPRPYHAQEVYTMFAQAFLGKKPRGRLPITLAYTALRLKPIRQWLSIEREALDYFNYDVYFDCQNTLQELKHTNIQCPDFRTYLPHMIDYYMRHQHDPTKHVQIQ
ncbi:thioester reductase-like protein [Alkalibacillus flavidus]|uniref:Thioester reductase-like protein n=1 Tax=Alkalibacillus flavidus TaxID=546021 RepID=A0ABV2L0D9_9BACI